MSARAGSADPMPPIPSAVHLLGVGGAGVSGLGVLLLARGVRVSGHDRARSPFCAELEAKGARLALGEPSRAEHLPADARWVVRSAAVPEDDPQVIAAGERGVPCSKYAQAVARLCPRGRTLAVAGTHGKTSTSWLLAHALREVAPGSGALIGGTCIELETNALPPAPGGWFAVEACEFDRSFLQLTPHAAAILNIDADHLDCFGSMENLVRAFAEFAARVERDGLLVLGEDVPDSVERAARCTVWRLGRELGVRRHGSESGRHRFDLTLPGGELQGVRLGVPGPFQVGNAATALALAAFAMGDAAPALGLGLARFRGAARRFELWAELAGRAIVHDYAHHPTELAATLGTAREVYPDRPLHLLFQPHQHGRTHRFLEEFARCLVETDRTLVADVYGARRAKPGEDLAGAPELVARARELGAAVELGGPRRAAALRFARELPEDAVGLVVGAGDIEDVRHDLLHELSLRAPAAGPAG